MLRLYENRAGPPKRGPASCDPRPRVNGLGRQQGGIALLVGLEILQIRMRK